MAAVKYGLFLFTDIVDVGEMSWVTTQFSTWPEYHSATAVHIEWPMGGKLCDGRLLLVHGIVFCTFTLIQILKSTFLYLQKIEKS